MNSASSPELVGDEVVPTPEPSPPQPVLPQAVIALVVSVLAIVMMVWATLGLRDYNHGHIVATLIGALLVLGTLYALRPTAKAFSAARETRRLLRDDQLVMARRASARGREDAQIGMGFAAAGIIVAGILLMAWSSDNGIAETFFASRGWTAAFPEMIRAFWINIWVAVVAFVLVLIFGLLIAVMRMLPGRAGAPLRMIAIAYCDIFRAVPAIVTIYIVVFGIPLAFPFAADWPLTWLGIIALTLTYSAYVAEVYRAGLASIHPSQAAAARSLGLGYVQTLRTVLVPQGVRRVIPPLLNDFISLQKDTALLSIAAIPEVFQVSTFWQAKLYILSPVTLAAAFFIIITIPQARFVDHLLSRDAAKRAGG